MNADFEMILEDCLKRILAGSSIEECLADYPAQAEALKPLLLVTSRVRKIARPQARPEAVQAGLERVMKAMSTNNIAQGIPSQPISKTWFSRYIERIITILRTILFGKENKGMKFALRLAIDFMVILVIGGVFAVNASASSLPGDTLYGVKRTWEEVRLNLTLNDPTRLELQNQFQQLRLDEVREMIRLGKAGWVDFEGQLESMTTNEWLVSGILLQMPANTIVEGNPVIGQMVRVKASLQNNGVLTALQVSIQAQTNNPNPYPAPVSSQTPMPTALPTHHIEPSQEPAHEATHEATHMPDDTEHSTQMPQPTYQPSSTHDTNHNNDPVHHDDSGDSGMNHH
jgi:hypothetical protein